MAWLGRMGLDCVGLGWTKLGWNELDSLKCGLRWIGLGGTGLDWVGSDWVGLNWVRFLLLPCCCFALGWVGLTHAFNFDLRFWSLGRKYCPDPFPDPPGTSLRGVRVAIGPGKHVTSRGPGRNRARVAIGPGKRVTSRGPGRNWTEKTRHLEGPGSQSDR